MRQGISAIALLLAGLVLAGCGGEESAGNGNDTRDSSPAPVRVARAEVREFTPTTPVAGTVVSRQDARVSAEVTGRLESVAEVGTEVAKGDVLAEIDDTQLRLRVAEQESVVTREEANLGYLRKQQERLESLEASNAAARNQLDQITSQRQVAESDLAVAKARLAQLRDQLDRTIIEAPFAGVVSERLSEPGERVTEGTAVVRILSTENREVQARARLEYLPFVGEGDPVRVRWRDQSHVGTVRAVVRAGDEVSHLFELRIDVPDSLWPIGQTVQVALPTANTRQALAVPRDAIVLRREGNSVYVVQEDGKARRVRVDPGRGDGDYVEVDGPVEPGDRVIIRGNERLEAGQAVNVLEG